MNDKGDYQYLSIIFYMALNCLLSNYSHIVII